MGREDEGIGIDSYAGVGSKPYYSLTSSNFFPPQYGCRFRDDAERVEGTPKPSRRFFLGDAGDRSPLLSTVARELS